MLFSEHAHICTGPFENSWLSTSTKLTQYVCILKLQYQLRTKIVVLLTLTFCVSVYQGFWIDWMLLSAHTLKYSTSRLQFQHIALVEHPLQGCQKWTSLFSHLPPVVQLTCKLSVTERIYPGHILQDMRFIQPRTYG